MQVAYLSSHARCSACVLQPVRFLLYLGYALQREEKLHQAVTDYSPVQWLIQSLYDPCESVPVATERACVLASKSRTDSVLLAAAAIETLWFCLSLS